MDIQEQRRRLSEFSDKEAREQQAFREASLVGSDLRDELLVEIIRSGIKRKE